MDNLPKVGVAAIIVKNSNVLLGKRKGSHGQGAWAFPGGHLEFNETWEDCVNREVAEEAGITVKNIRFAAATNDIFEKEGKHYITLFMRADYKSGMTRVMEPEKCEQWQWFSWDNLPEPLFLTIQLLLKQNYNPFTSP